MYRIYMCIACPSCRLFDRLLNTMCILRRLLCLPTLSASFTGFFASKVVGFPCLLSGMTSFRGDVVLLMRNVRRNGYLLLRIHRCKAARMTALPALTTDFRDFLFVAIGKVSGVIRSRWHCWNRSSYRQNVTILTSSLCECGLGSFGRLNLTEGRKYLSHWQYQLTKRYDVTMISLRGIKFKITNHHYVIYLELKLLFQYMTQPPCNIHHECTSWGSSRLSNYN